VRTVCFTGSRGWRDRSSVAGVIDDIHRPFRGIVGGAPGFDTIVEEALVERGIPYLRFDAKWSRYRNAAGSRRNGLMLDWLRRLDPQGVLVVGHDGVSRGTADCVAQATAMLVPCRTVTYFPERNREGGEDGPVREAA